MQRAVVFVLILSALFSPALAGPRPQVSGDPAIDAQWIAQLRRPPQVIVNRPGLLHAVFGRDVYVVEDPVPVTRPGMRRAVVRTAPAPVRTIDPAYLPALVDYRTSEKPGTIVIDPSERYLYLILDNGKAQRYGVGVGREGFGWSGTVKVGRKAEWPTWTPPAEMRQRQPYLPVSMPGGPKNPLGARALYLYRGGNDTLFRIHGSNEPWTIGHSVSSGCFRMRNEDVTALYSRVGVGTRVVVL